VVSSKLQVHSSYITDTLSKFSLSSDYNKSVDWPLLDPGDWFL